MCSSDLSSKRVTKSRASSEMLSQGAPSNLMSSLRMEVMMPRGLRFVASRQKGRWPDSICTAAECEGQNVGQTAEWQPDH